jgi:hypothetical protein
MMLALALDPRTLLMDRKYIGSALPFRKQQTLRIPAKGWSLFES